MTKSTITRERLEKIKSWREIYGAGSNVMLPAEEAAELARIALTAMDSEPVAYAWVSRSGKKHLTRCEPEQWRDAVIVTPLYRHAQPAPELAAIVERLNLSGYEYEGGEVTPQNAAAIVDTLLQQLDDAVQGRNAQPAPTIQVTDAMAYAFHHALTDGPLGDDDVEDIKTGLRAAFATVTIKQPAPVVQCPYPCGWDNLNKLAIQDAALVARGLVEGEPTTEAQRQAAISNNDRLLKVISACRAAMLQAEPVCTCPSGDGSLRWPCPVHPGNSPVIPDTWIPVSERIPEDEQEVLTINRMGHRFVSFFDKHSGLFFDRLDAPAACCIEHVLVTHWMPLPAAPQEVKP